MRGFSLIVLFETLPEVCGQPNVALVVRGQAFNKVDIEQGPALLRSSFGGHPASLERSCQSCEARRAKQDGGEGGIRTHGELAPTTVFETVPIDHSGTSPRSAAV